MCVCMCVFAHGHRRVVVVVAGTQQVIPSSYSTDTSSSTHAHDDELLGPHLLCARTQTLIYMTNEEERRGGNVEMRISFSAPATPARSRRRKGGNERDGGGPMTVRRALWIRLESVHLGPEPVFTKFACL